MALSSDTLKSILVNGAVLKEHEFETVEAAAKRSGVTVPRLLISEGRLTQQYLNQLVGKFLDIPLFDIRVNAPKIGVVELLPESIARQREVLVFEKDQEKNTFKVAIVDPTNVETMNFLREYLKGDIQPFLATLDDLRTGYQLYKKKSAEAFEATIEAKIKALSTNFRGQGNILESLPLAELFDGLLDYGAILEASDIFFQPEETHLKVRFRIDGILRDILSLDKSINEGVVARVKSLANLRIDEHMKPQDGRFRFKANDVDVDVRCAVMPSLFGEKTTLRLLSGAQSFLSFEELGMDMKTIEKLRVAAQKPFGMILSSGPTGSGKTTTIYTILALLNRPEVHITTIEDPIEYIVPNVSQTQVNMQADITFASGLRALLRHSPDVIFIGEIRDEETADVSVNAALTGHLLISTIHTNNAPSSIIRLLDLDIQPFLISATLNAVLAQRLVRKICVNCIESTAIPEPVKREIETQFEKIKKPVKLPGIAFRGKGCSICGHTGFKGRVGIFEIFTIDDALRSAINTHDLTLEKIEEAVKKQGMITMFEDGLQKVELGLTTPQELIRVISE